MIIQGRKEMFYLTTHQHILFMVKDLSDSERQNLLLLLHEQDNTYHSLYYTSCGELAHGSTMKDRSSDLSHHEHVHYPGATSRSMTVQRPRCLGNS